MWTAPTLLISDPNLGAEARARLSAVCTDLTEIRWDVSHPGRVDDIQSRIAAGRWDLAVSFYSDLILSPRALAAIALPLNIHPALPSVGGVGHDVAPLVERHASVGATLHRMERTVDTGRILDVIEVPLAAGHTYASLRALNQATSLRLLERLCGAMAEAEGALDLEAKLAAGGADYRWGRYYSRAEVAALRAARAAELDGAAAPEQQAAR